MILMIFTLVLMQFKQW